MKYTTIEDFMKDYHPWSLETFGSGFKTNGVTDHIKSECSEVVECPHDLMEWVDIIMLSLDGYARHGGSPDKLLALLSHKFEINQNRSWPAPTDADVATYHNKKETLVEEEPSTSIFENEESRRDFIDKISRLGNTD